MISDYRKMDVLRNLSTNETHNIHNKNKLLLYAYPRLIRQS